MRVLREGIVIGLSNHTLLIARDGREIPIADSGAPIHDHNAAIAGVVLVFRDQTDEWTAQKQLKESHEHIKRALAEKETLLRELFHRTKNTMQVITSMLALQAAQSQSPEVHKLVRDTEHRIYAMSLVHQKLYENQDLSRIDLGVYLTELTRFLMKNSRMPETDVRLTMDVQPISALLDTAIPCGLVVNELMSNALQHAFPDGRKGEISLRLQRTPEGRIKLSFADTGIGVPPGFDVYTQQTMGMQIIITLVQHQLQGKIHFNVQQGFACDMYFIDNLYTPRV